MTHDIQEPSKPSSSSLTKFFLRSFVLVGGGLALTACPLGTELEDGDQQHDVRYSKVCAPAIFENNCSGIACHTPGKSGAAYGGIDLMSPGLPARLYNQPASYKNVVDASNCPTTPELLVDPSNPGASLLLKKVYGTGFACGTGMPDPIDLFGLAPEQLECLTDYVNAVVATGGAE